MVSSTLCCVKKAEGRSPITQRLACDVLMDAELREKTSSAALEQRLLSSGALQSRRGSTFLQSPSFQMERVKGNGSKSAR